MANYQLITLPSKMLVTIADTKIKHLLDNYESLSIQSQVQLIAAASKIFQDFYNNLGKSLTSPIIFQGIPIAEEWNTYQRAVADDMSILYQETGIITQQTLTNLTYGTIENRLLISAANTLKNQVASFQATRPVRLGSQKWTAGDDFYDSSKIDINNTTSIVTSGNVELQRLDSKDFTDQVKIVVDDEYITSILAQSQLQQLVDPFKGIGPSGLSNGFIGNTHEVQVVENTNPLTTAQLSSADNSIIAAVQLNANPGETVSFLGDFGLHADINAVLDGDPNTWFEYEVCNFPDVLKQTPCSNYGFTMTIGRSNGTTLEVPWYSLHDSTKQPSATGASVDPTRLNENLFPPPAGTSYAHPLSPSIDPVANYLTPSGVADSPTTGQSTLTVPASASNIVLPESGMPRNGSVLRLALNAVLTEEQILTQITILPNILHNKIPRVNQILVRGTADANWLAASPVRTIVDPNQFIDVGTKSVTLNNVSSGDNLEVWAFPPHSVKYVRIIIEQPNSYDADIGHIVWVREDNKSGLTTGNNPDFFDSLYGGKPHDDATTSSAAVIDHRIDGPKMALESLVKAAGILQNPQDLNSITKIGITGAVLSLIPGINSSTGNVPQPATTNSSQLGPFIEYFSGWRYAIGIRDISFGTYQYAVSSQLVSQDFEVPIDINQIALQVHEEIPSSIFAPDFDTDTEWITYDISVDGGNTWYPIAPASHYFSTRPQIYHVNPIGGDSSVVKNHGSITVPNYDPVHHPINRIRLRATFSRPDSLSSLSPHLHRYQLQLEGATY